VVFRGTRPGSRSVAGGCSAERVRRRGRVAGGCSAERVRRRGRVASCSAERVRGRDRWPAGVPRSCGHVRCRDRSVASAAGLGPRRVSGVAVGSMRCSAEQRSMSGRPGVITDAAGAVDAVFRGTRPGGVIGGRRVFRGTRPASRSGRRGVPRNASGVAVGRRRVPRNASGGRDRWPAGVPRNASGGRDRVRVRVKRWPMSRWSGRRGVPRNGGDVRERRGRSPMPGSGGWGRSAERLAGVGGRSPVVLGRVGGRGAGRPGVPRPGGSGGAGAALGGGDGAGRGGFRQAARRGCAARP
jgi:hypothetical protein